MNYRKCKGAFQAAVSACTLEIHCRGGTSGFIEIKKEFRKVAKTLYTRKSFWRIGMYLAHGNLSVSIREKPMKILVKLKIGNKIMIDEILKYNRDYVARNGYEEHVTDKYPNKRLAILTCMDTRLTRLLPDALGLKNGDVKLIKNAGGLISDPWGNEIRSLLVAIFELHCNEVMVIHHTHCGAAHMNAASMIQKMEEHGISKKAIEDAHKNEFDFEAWLEGFGDTEESVRRTVAVIRNHQMIPMDVNVRGFIIDSTTGELKEIK